METKFNVMVRLDAITLMALPGGVSETEAREQERKVCQHFMQFPGGTQSVSVWSEPTL